MKRKQFYLRFWNQVAVSIFNDDNRYTASAFLLFCIYHLTIIYNIKESRKYFTNNNNNTWENMVKNKFKFYYSSIIYAIFLT